MVQVHVAPPVLLPPSADGRLATEVRELRDIHRGWRVRPVKKLFIVALLVLGGLAVWRKIQAQRADLDLWSEATADDY